MYNIVAVVKPHVVGELMAEHPDWASGAAVVPSCRVRMELPRELVTTSGHKFVGGAQSLLLGDMLINALPVGLAGELTHDGKMETADKGDKKTHLNPSLGRGKVCTHTQRQQVVTIDYGQSSA